MNFYLPGGFEKVIMEFGVPAKSRTLPPPNLKAPGTPEQMTALLNAWEWVPVAPPDVLRETR